MTEADHDVKGEIQRCLISNTQSQELSNASDQIRISTAVR